MMAETQSEIINKVKSVMDANGIPSYIWLPIVAQESSFNPNATNNNGTEYSEGLFQINVMANPAYSKYNLYDVTTNATIAAQNFLAPAFAYAQGVTSDKKQQALIVYSGLKNPQDFNYSKANLIPSGGIQPAWTTDLYNSFSTYFDQYQNTLPSALPIKNTSGITPDTNTGASGKTTDYSVPAAKASTFTSNMVRIGIISVLIIAALYAMFQLFKSTDAGSKIIETTKQAATTAALGGQFPTVFQIYNFGIATVAVSDNPNVSATQYLFQVAAGGVAVYANPKSTSKLYFFSIATCPLVINTWAATDVQPSDLYQTQATVIINSTTTSSVSLAAPIPAGGNTIGGVNVIAALPAGANNIGKVTIDSTTSLPTGANVIGHVVVDSQAVSDGANLALGAKADTQNTNPASSGSLIAFIKGILTACQASTPAGANNIGKVTIDSTTSLPTGANTIGNVGLNAGANIIGKVNISDFSTAVPTLYNVSLAATGTEYSQAFTNAKKIVVSIQGGAATDNFRLAYVTGKVATPTAPYLQYSESTVYLMDNINIASGTLYLATTKAGVTAQIEIW